MRVSRDAVCQGETMVMVPFMPTSAVRTELNGTIPGRENRTKNCVVLPPIKSWLYPVPLLVYVNVWGASSSFKIVIFVTTDAVTLITLGENREFEASMETLATIGISYTGPALGARAVTFWYARDPTARGLISVH